MPARCHCAACRESSLLQRLVSTLADADPSTRDDVFTHFCPLCHTLIPEGTDDCPEAECAVGVELVLSDQ